MKSKKNKKIIIVVIVVITLAVVLFFIIDKSSKKGETVTTKDIKVVPLTLEEKQKVISTVLSSEFIKDIPENNPIALTFFSFENGERVWRDSFLIGRNQLLSEGNPAVHLSLPSKYISEFSEDNLCDIIKEANKNGDLGFYSEHSEVSLFIKYAGMLKHRECFGF